MTYTAPVRDLLFALNEVAGFAQLRAIPKFADCDGDTVLLLVEQEGVACHTGRRNCFFRAWRGGRLETIAEPLVSPDSLYGET